MKYLKLNGRFTYTGQFLLENLLPIPRGVTVGSNLTWDFSGGSITWGALTATSTLTASAAFVGSSTGSFAGALTPTGGVVAAGGSTAPTVFHSGGVGHEATSPLTQTQIVTTDSYLCEIFIPMNSVITGISLMNGHTTNGSVNLSVGLANSAGTIVAKSATTVAQSTADTYQQIPFTATYSAVGPAKYYVVVQGSTTTGYLATHTIGNFGATLITSETYGTFLTTASYSNTTFTTARGPVADTY
jgi:hypothetical protein